MDRELEEASLKLAWLNYACVKKEFQSCVTLLSELKVYAHGSTSSPSSLSPERGFGSAEFWSSTSTK